MRRPVNLAAMRLRASTLLVLTLLGLLLLATVWLRLGPPGFLGGARNIPVPDPQVVVLDPLADPLLGGYREFRDALAAGDLATLAEISTRDDSYVAYRAALTLARSFGLTPQERLPHYARVLEVRLADPLARLETRAFHLEIARTAEAAGDTATAFAHFREALPDAEAVTALARLEDDPYRLANAYFAARQYRNALNALDGLPAPSITAPSHRALGEHELALAAYEDWLLQEPGSTEAQLGRAWSNFNLGNNEASDAQFSEIAGSNALYGRGLLANRAGDIAGAISFFEQSGEPAHLWLGTDILENRGMYAEAIPVYLRLARGTSAYADQAAYRALVLAERLGDTAAATEARGLIRPNTFFALVLGEPLTLPTESTVAATPLPVLDLATALARAGDLDAAIGELVFALRRASDTNEIVALASRLQAYGEFRQSRLGAQALLDAGSRDVAVWRLAYPEAYPDEVRAAAANSGIEPELVWAVMRQESAFYPLAISTSNAHGLMQVIPSTWDWLAELQREAPGDSFDVAANIRYGAFYLSWLLNYLDGDMELAVASYNRGQGYIGRLYAGDEVAGDKSELYRRIDAQETRNYLERVIVNYHVYHGLAAGVGEQASLLGWVHLAEGN